MNILITGGAGFIGSHTCVELLNGGHRVVIADNFSNSKPETIENIGEITGKKVKLYEIDLRDYGDTLNVFKENEIDAVIHFAGLKSVAESVEQPLDYYQNNIDGTLSLLNAMKEAGCGKIVFSSSATVYGMNNKAPFKEDMPTSATNPYGYTKVMIEQILKDFQTANPEIGVCSLRYFNPIGAHESGLLGEDPNGVPNNLVPYVSQTAAGLRPEILVYGGDYLTPDGTGVRDYIHVVDLARGHLAALNYIEENAGVHTVNLGTGKGTSVLEIIKAYSKACGKELPYRIVGRRAGDIDVCYADTQKARDVLGWRAELDIDKMCEDSWNFAKNRYGA